MTIKIVEPKVANNPAEYIIKTDKLKEKEKLTEEEPTAYLMISEEECPNCKQSNKKLGLRCQFHELIFEAKQDALKEWRKKIEDRIADHDKALKKLNKEKKDLEEKAYYYGNKQALEKLNAINLAIFGVESSKKELKSLVESDGIPQTSKIPIKEQNESAIDVSKDNKDGAKNPVLVEKCSSENSKDNKSTMTIHSVEVVTPELIAKSMFPKKKDDKK